MILIHQKFWKNTIPVVWLDMINKDVLFGLYPLDPWTLKGYFIRPKRLTLFVTPSNVCKNRKKIWEVNLKRYKNNECLLPCLSFDLTIVHFLSWKFHVEQWLSKTLSVSEPSIILPCSFDIHFLVTYVFVHSFSWFLISCSFFLSLSLSLYRSHLETCFTHF